MEDIKVSLVECIARKLGFTGEGNPEILIKEEISRRHAITDIELSFQDDKSEIIITTKADNGNSFSKCISVDSSDPGSVVFKFWDTLQECENFMAGEYMKW